MQSNRLDVVEDSSSDVLGPVDYVVVEFPADKANFSGEMAIELNSLVDRKLVRVLDLVILRKNSDGSVEAAELHEVDEDNVGKLRALEADLAMLLAAEDIERFGEVLEPGSIAAVLVYENSWAGPFAVLGASGGRPTRGQRSHPNPGATGRDRSGRQPRVEEGGLTVPGRAGRLGRNRRTGHANRSSRGRNRRGRQAQVTTGREGIAVMTAATEAEDRRDDREDRREDRGPDSDSGLPSSADRSRPASRRNRRLSSLGTGSGG